MVSEIDMYIQAVLTLKHVNDFFTSRLSVGNSDIVGGVCCNIDHILKGRVLKCLDRLSLKNEVRKY
jgi:hypothetical protein